MDKKVAIIGRGWVGTAMKKLFPDAIMYDREEKNRYEVNLCDVVFIAVPTSLLPSGKLDISIVEECVAWCQCPLIVIRSTVNPGDTDRLIKKYNKKIIFQPEYLGETPNHPLLDTKQTNFLIIGGDIDNRRLLIDLYTNVYNANTTIRQVTALEAEIIKLTENRAIAFKVAQSQELYDVCEKAGVDYYTIRDAVYGDDPRFNLWWTFIFKNKRGFHSSKCLKKDVEAWSSWAETLGYDPIVTKTIVERSKEYEKD